jgi:hypothetical protein
VCYGVFLQPLNAPRTKERTAAKILRASAGSSVARARIIPPTDLADASALGMASSPGIPFDFGSGGANSGLMTTLPWILIPCFNVPLLAHLHLLIFQRLWRSRAASKQVQHAPRHSS